MSRPTTDSNFRIVPYRSDDFSLGEALGREHGETSSDLNVISAALSLYFQWPNERNSVLAINSTDEVISCELDYDRDERTPTELHINIRDSASSKKYVLGETIIVRFEVFSTAYSFSGELLDSKKASEDSSWKLIITVPKEIAIHKLRRLPRTHITATLRNKLPEVFWLNEPTSKPLRLEVTEVGSQSLKIQSPDPIPLSSGLLIIGENKYSAAAIRRVQNEVVIAVSFRTGIESGSFFDFYRQAAYPYLRNKFEIPPEQALTAYSESGFFNKFTEGLSPNEMTARLDLIKSTWKNIADGLHEATADYVAVDDSEKPVGASSAVLGFFNGQKPVWVLQQYCALAKPEYIEQTRELYSWRAEYLAARPEDLEICCWFDAGSRWIERIWLKFASQMSGNRNCVIPVQIRVIDFLNDKHTGDSSSINFVTYNIGKEKRVATKSETLLAAMGPNALNAAGLLDHIYDRSEKPDFENIERTATALLYRVSNSSSQFRVSLPYEYENPKIKNAPIHKLNRFCLFSKLDLGYFYSSLEHSLAVIKRKIQDNG